MADPKVVRKCLMLAKKEAVSGTDANPTAADDAFLVEEPNFEADINWVERNFYVPHLSPQPVLPGYKLGRITARHELRGNSLVDSGLIGDAPKIARLIELCGFELSALSGLSQVGAAIPAFGNVGAVNWTTGGVVTLVQPAQYAIRCTTPGGTGAAEVTITCNNPAVDPAPDVGVVLTNDTPVTLSGSGATITPNDIISSLAAGDTFYVLVVPPGVAAKPISGGYSTGTIELFKDGKRHRILGAMGTFSITSEAGARAYADFTFTGVMDTTDYDEAFPASPVFEVTTCPLVERSLITWGENFQLKIGGWSFELAAGIAPRMDANSPEGIFGMWTSSRGTRGGFSPEVTSEAEQPFWVDMTGAVEKQFFARVGKVQGNMVLIQAPRVQTDNLGYSDREGISVYDKGMRFNGFAGDDEVRFFFC